MRTLFPTPSLALLIGIGIIDMITTAWLHAEGKIVELNPLMRGFILHSEWTFVLVKSLTLIAAWYAMARYAKKNRAFVQHICLMGSGAYVAIWLIWFCVGG